MLKQGRIIFNNRYSVIDCLVRDVSVGGCRLRLHTTLTLPPRFVLGFPALGVERQVQLIWQKDRDAGVAFLDPAPPAFVRLALPPGMPGAAPGAG
ncbi:MAG TPA: hypothetical protein ENJ62_04040 [Bryobacterales bacterium]|nr:hypothetical protein [Bryobacterales bacterium]